MFEVRDQLWLFRLVITAVISVFLSLAMLRVFLIHYFTSLSLPLLVHRKNSRNPVNHGKTAVRLLIFGYIET